MKIWKLGSLFALVGGLLLGGCYTSKDWECVCDIGGFGTTSAFFTNQSQKDAEALCQAFEEELRVETGGVVNVSCSVAQVK